MSRPSNTMDEEREAVRNFPKNEEALNLPEDPSANFDLTALPDPPPDFTFLDRRYEDIWNERNFKAAPTKLLGRLHFWGIYFTDRFTPTKTIILMSLWKLMYHMPERNRPRTVTELYSLDRDTGPRLLGWEHHDPDVGPISRFHLNRPNPEQETALGYVRPRDAPSSVTDIEVERYLLPVDRNSVHSVQPSQRSQPTQPSKPRQSRRRRKRHVSPEVDAEFELDPEFEPEVEPEVALQEAFAPPSSPMKGLPVFTPRGLSPVIPSAQSLPGYQLMTEELEKLIYKHTYYHLERAPSAPQRTPGTKRIAQSIHDLETVQIGTHSAHSHLRLNPRTLNLDTHSTHLYPYRGRGPVWSSNSCSVDCVIVLGMLLDVGCTNLDRESSRWKKLTDLEKAFIEITNVNWDALTSYQSIQMRDLFRRKLCAELPTMDMVSPQPAWAIWSECTKNIEQFYFHFADFYQSCPCTNQQFVEGNKVANSILPSIDFSDAEGVWLSDLVERVIYDKRHSPCIHCGADTDVWETRIEQLPARLVVSNYLGHRVRVFNHTEDLRFRYIDEFGIEKVAAYRWLGGIYHKDNHVRVFWSDQERGDQLRTTIRMYDDEVNGGAICGGIPPAHPNDRVPYDWTNIGFLIGVYERIINPSVDMLTKASESLRRMEMAIDSGKAIIDKHHPWLQEYNLNDPQNPVTERFNPPDESRVIPITAEQFREVKLAELPASVPRDNNTLQFDDLQQLLTAWPPEDQTMEDAPPQYDNLFDSMLNSPARLANFPELWPNGVPNENGALGFPNLPRSNSSKGSKSASRPRTPVMDYLQWPSSSSSNGSRRQNPWGKAAAGMRATRKAPRPEWRPLSVTKERRSPREVRKKVTRQERASTTTERFPKQEPAEKDVKPKIKTEKGSQAVAGGSLFQAKRTSTDKQTSKDKAPPEEKVTFKDPSSSLTKAKVSKNSRGTIPAKPADSSSSNSRKRQNIGENSTTERSRRKAKTTSNPKGIHTGAITRHIVDRAELRKIPPSQLSSFERARLRSSPRDILMPDAPPLEEGTEGTLEKLSYTQVANVFKEMKNQKRVENANSSSGESEDGDYSEESEESEYSDHLKDDKKAKSRKAVEGNPTPTPPKPKPKPISNHPAIPQPVRRMDILTGKVYTVIETPDPKTGTTPAPTTQANSNVSLSNSVTTALPTQTQSGLNVLPGLFPPKPILRDPSKKPDTTKTARFAPVLEQGPSNSLLKPIQDPANPFLKPVQDPSKPLVKPTQDLPNPFLKTT
ncbi:hypothetical protein N7493_002334 [Penicillium malachiteum]|uniref:Uncharacterized protein n=1 Tax=Penicillium malachiteum TaxID=1324776 RepID=A0AAD6HSB1_9EURO|nr:hypothetical protein N7493_002334 [Penicillium malachiteum]